SNNNHFKLIVDQLGSVRLVVNATTGVVVQQMNHDEFGKATMDTSPGLQPFGFAGGLYDSDTKLVRFGLRDFDSEIGRWNSKDVIRFDTGDTNLYGYTSNDPVNFIDAEGLYKYSPTAGGPVDSATGAALSCFESCSGLEITVTAGKEGGHSPGSAHATGQACDVGKNSNPNLTRPVAQQCFSKCFNQSTSFGQEEGNHFHFQTRPGKGGAVGGFPLGIK
ncbi:MAG: RHS repeat-associated core domain-containing protein, partial [Bacteriovorax sp.]|nr:RHS repeat-associated core domain-containing protein [Bacteriovorax sp.]